MLYAIACGFGGRLQIADKRVAGITSPRPCDLATPWRADIIAARLADDTQNLRAREVRERKRKRKKREREDR